MSDLGEQPLGTNIVFNFTTAVNGVPTLLAGSPAITVYKNNTTGSTAGVAITASYNSVVGFNHVTVDTTADTTFYAAGNFFSVIISTGTLAGVSMVGYVVGSFQLTTRATNIDKTLNAVIRGTVTTGASTTSVPTSALTTAGAAASGVVVSQFVGRVMLFDGATTTAGLQGVASAISASTASNTPTFTVATLPATPVSGDLFSVI